MVKKLSLFPAIAEINFEVSTKDGANWQVMTSYAKEEL
jgi:hypothetical protein